MTRILAICGSLRAHSTNKTLLEAVRRLAPDGIEVDLYDGLAELPHFNPDLAPDLFVAPAEVTRLRTLVGQADGLLISSPEYAHGIPGSLKNALDWLVGGSEMVGKPVALLNASPRATHAQEALRETLKTMSARLVEGAFVAVPLLGKNWTAEEVLAHPEISRPLSEALASFTEALQQGHTEGAEIH